MPITYVKKLAKKHGMSTDMAEKHWETAKKQAAKQGREENYAYVTSIFKSMLGENEESLIKQKSIT